MSPQPSAWTCHPRITFQDTNVVGNVYFLTFFRWQAECRDEWLRSAKPDLWKKLSAGEQHFLITHWSTRFEDPFGATIGDDVSATLSITESGRDRFDALAEIFKHCDGTSTRIASGCMKFTTRRDLDPTHNGHPTGPCYLFTATTRNLNPVELLAWQGKCRELFLADHAADTLRRVAQRELILQTTTASIDMIQIPPAPIDEVEVEMRLETLKCGQMGVRFDYFTDAPDGTSVRFAKGSQTMSSKHQNGSSVVPCPLPVDLLSALKDFTESTQVQAKIDDILSFSSASQQGVATSSFLS